MMTDEQKMEMLAKMMGTGNVKIGQFIMDNHGTMNIDNNMGEEKRAKSNQQVSVETLVACANQVRDYFWGDSSLAVIFCACRDSYGYADNMSQFERDFQCQEGLLSNTFRNNPYMRLHVDKWKENGAKERALRLAEAYENAVDERLKK